MSADSNKRKRNTQIPPEAIAGAAGIHDKTGINSYVVEIDCPKEVDNPDKKNTRTVTGDAYAREVISTELKEGMSIVVKDGGKPVTKDGREI